MKTFALLLAFALTFTYGNIYTQWVYQQPPNNASYYLAIDFPGVTTGVTGGVFLGADFYGRGAYTTNSGTNWLVSQVPDSSRVLLKIIFINTTTGFSAGAYNTASLNHPLDPEKYDKRSLQLLKEYNFSSGNNYKGLFMKTTNSGQNWFSYGSLPANVYYLFGLAFVNSTTGYATVTYNASAGVNDGIIKTTNGGLNWSPLAMPEVLNSLNEIYFQDINTGYAVGFDEVNDTARGLIVRTTNAGTSWTRQVFSQVREFSGISFSNASTGLTVSIADPISGFIEGRVFKTTNSGLNWNSTTIIPDAELQGVNFIPATGTALLHGTKYLPGFENIEFLSKTTNYGNNWSSFVLNDTGIVIFDSKLMDANNWYFTGGSFGTVYEPIILHTTTGGVLGLTNASTEIPESFSLSQNYPNPFNPVTNIEFKIPEAGIVTLAVYDVMGREVSRLVSHMLKPAVYKVDFDASKLTSGIYFYRLQANGFTDTKKMILVK